MSPEGFGGPGELEPKFSAPNFELNDGPEPSGDILSENQLVECIREDGTAEMVQIREWWSNRWWPGDEGDVSVELVPGFAETIGSLDDFAGKVAQLGDQRVLGFEHPHSKPKGVSEQGGDWRRRFAVNHQDRGERLGAVREAAGIEKVDLVAHSQGCIDAIVAAYLSLEDGSGSVRNLILINPGGVVDPEGTHVTKLAAMGMVEAADLASRALRHPSRLGKFIKNAGEVVEDVVRHPKLTFDEAKAIAATDMSGCLGDLREQGIHVAIVAGKGDRLFPLERIQKALHEGDVDGFYSVEGGHNELTQNPQKMAELVVKIQDDLANGIENEENYERAV